MDPVKASSSQPVSAPDPGKRVTEAKPPEKSDSDPDVVAAKKAAEPRPTTNTQGQTLGQHVNVTA